LLNNTATRQCEKNQYTLAGCKLKTIIVSHEALGCNQGKLQEKNQSYIIEVKTGRRAREKKNNWRKSERETKERI